MPTLLALGLVKSNNRSKLLVWMQKHQWYRNIRPLIPALNNHWSSALLAMPVKKTTWQQENGSATICRNSTSIQYQAAKVAQLHTQEHSQSRPPKSLQNTEMAQLHSTSYCFHVLSPLLQLVISVSQKLPPKMSIFHQHHKFDDGRKPRLDTKM